MPRGRTGAEIIKGWVTGKKPIPVEKQFFNPLDAKVGSHGRFTNTLVTLRGEADVDITGELFTVTAIWSWLLESNGNKHNLADYVLESGDKRLVVRVAPTTSMLFLVKRLTGKHLELHRARLPLAKV